MGTASGFPGSSVQRPIDRASGPGIEGLVEGEGRRLVAEYPGAVYLSIMVGLYIPQPQKVKGYLLSY